MASACNMMGGLDLGYVLSADVVVIGRIRDSRRATYSERDGDYRRFNVEVEEVLHGTGSNHLAVTWADLGHGMPDRVLSKESHLVALHWPTTPDLDGYVLFAPEPDVLTVLQAPCDPPFIMRADSDAARAVRKVLDGEGDAQAEVQRLSESVNMDSGNLWREGWPQ